MTSKTHEELLLAGIKAMEDQGYRVVRMDRRVIPDAICIKDNQVVALEADTSPSNVWLSRRKYGNTRQYDEQIIVTRPFSTQFHKKETYDRVMELYLEGNSYREIKRKVMGEFDLKTLSVSTVYDWIKGRKRPITL